MKFFISTKNNHKVEEFKKIFSGTGIEFLCENDLSKNFPDVEENGTTFEENAMLKAKAGAANTGMPTIADDSGLCVDFLNGEPGIYSARYAGSGDSKDNVEKLLKALDGVPKDKRTARFVCVVACVFPDGREFAVSGECEGYIAEKPQGDGGFGYDPIFVSSIGCFGTVPAEAKNKVSHRANAIKAFKEKLKEENYNVNE